MGDLNEWMAKAKAYDSLNERIGDLATKLHERDMRIRQLEEEAAATNELLKRSWDQAMMAEARAKAAEARAKAAEAREVGLLKAVNDAYPTIAGHVISLEQAGETVAHEQWAKLARQLYAAARPAILDRLDELERKYGHLRNRSWKAFEEDGKAND